LSKDIFSEDLEQEVGEEANKYCSGLSARCKLELLKEKSGGWMIMTGNADDYVNHWISR